MRFWRFRRKKKSILLLDSSLVALVEVIDIYIYIFGSLFVFPSPFENCQPLAVSLSIR